MEVFLALEFGSCGNGKISGLELLISVVESFIL